MALDIAPDPEGAFVAYLRSEFPAATVSTDVPAERPAIVVDLVPGGTTIKRRHIDRVPLNLVCYGGSGDNPTLTAWQLAGQVRNAVLGGFTAAGNRVMQVAADPPYPLADPLTFEPRSFVGVSASIYARPPA